MTPREKMKTVLLTGCFALCFMLVGWWIAGFTLKQFFGIFFMLYANNIGLNNKYKDLK